MNRSIQKRGLALALVVAMGSVHAQSTTGSIVGSVGQGSGTSVLVENNSGLSREVPVDARGRYTAGNLPLGTYKVTVKRDGAVVETRENVAITVGANTDVSFAANAAGSGVQTLDSVTVNAASLTTIDVSSVDTRTVVTAEQLQQLPLGRTAEAIALLAPGVVVNSGGFDNGPLGGSLPSFGGSAASENAYYLNGFNTTTISNNLGGLTLPYGAIDQQEIFTGGYGAQYGRANGGVINQIGKRGTNAWTFGAAVIWEPNGLKANQRDIYWRPDSQGSTINNAAYRYARAANGLYQPASEAEASQTTYSAYVGGLIIQDKLFFFLAAEQVNSDGVRVGTNRDTDNGRTGGLTDDDYKQKRWYAKVDWNITDNHLIEVTGASDVAETNGSIYRYDYLARRRGAYFTNESTWKTGPTLFTGKYTGYLGDNLTVTALYGKMRTPDELTPFNYDAAGGPVINSAALQNPAYTGGTPRIGNQLVASVSSPDREYKKDNQRLNLEWRIGHHTLNVGIDNQTSEGIDVGSILSGPGYAWTYGQTNDPYGLATGGLVSQSANEAGGVGAPSPGLVDPVNGASGYYVVRNINTRLYSYEAKQRAYYIEDKWQVTDNVLLSLGLRKDEFTNYTPFGDPYIEIDNAWAPRLGFSWDVNGDSSLKVFGNLGRYYLGLPLSAVGLFTPAATTDTYFTYSGINADGTPILAQQLGSAVSVNSRFGRIADVRTAVAKDIEGENQDELILGFTRQLDSGWVLGVRGTHRRLNAGIDDQNYDVSNTALIDAAAAQGVTIDFSKVAGAALINPGQTNTWGVIGTDGQFHEVSVSRQAAGFPKFKRNYSAVEFNLERPFDGKWYAKVNYVWSHSYGTTEGQVRSDLWRTGGALGSYQGQASVSTTQSWDHAALMEHFNGDQSNDHRHQLKLFGFYQFTPQWGASANVSLISGAPHNCLGNYYGIEYSGRDPAGYGGSAITGGPYHYCYNPETGTGVASPPGSQGRLGWIAQLDMGVTYKPAFADGKLALRFDVFNITNAQTATNIYPFSQLPDNTTNPLWDQVVAYQAPRSGRVTLSYDF
ncbi:TonB-dependent receptor [Xanthomonas oryzae pv. oryzicola]|uniref:TonB-dependent receptor n=1 Tax=Xanthomonas oryzae TaxID=347 RepID=UPI0006554740|nr:TonB-dependent receptor [Xanthomonas oryzae]AKO03632.1 Oar protein [Xanthomonas oryzae pv. oryzicola]OWB26265.1 Oar protein [Xanthomonas oryzae pv. oryzicola]